MERAGQMETSTLEKSQLLHSIRAIRLIGRFPARFDSTRQQLSRCIQHYIVSVTGIEREMWRCMRVMRALDGGVQSWLCDALSVVRDVRSRCSGCCGWWRWLRCCALA